MLEQMRSATKSWLGIIVGGVLIISFALWGVQDIFTTDLNDPIATVGDTDIGAQEFLVTFNQDLQRMRSQLGGDFSQADAISIGMDRSAIESIVQRTLMDREANSFGLRASDQRIRDEIRNNSAFRGPTGRFDQDTFQETIYRMGFTQDSFALAMRQDMARNQLISSMVSGAFMPQDLVTSLYRYESEERVMEYFMFPAEAAGDFGDADAATLEAYYINNLTNYQTPEYRALTVLVISPESLIPLMEVTEEDIQITYEIRESLYVVPERRTVDQLAFRTEEAANTALASLERGAAFQEVGGAFIPLGSVAPSEMGDLATSEAAFALTEPGRTGVVEGTLGFAILRVVDITPGSQTPFEEVRDEIRDDLARQAADEEIYEIYEQAADMRAGGEDIAVIGERLRQQVITVNAIDRTGLDRYGEINEEIAGMQGLLRDAFAAFEGEDSNFKETEDVYYVVRVDSIAPASVHPYEDVSVRVTNDWRNDEVTTRLRTLADETATRINAGEDFTDVAADMGRIIRLTPRPVGRTGTTEIFTQDVLTQLFQQPVGTAVAGKVQLGISHIVTRVTDVQEADLSNSAEELTAMQQQLSRNLADEVVLTFVEHAQANTDVRVNEVVLRQALNYQGQ